MQSPYDIDFYLLIPCYNNIEGLARSLRSVKYDSDKFIVLIVDDGSDEPIEKENLLSLAQINLPLEIIRMPQNQGITKALNAGLKWIGTKNNFQYIARLDCGDICDPKRFYDQVQFLDKNQHIDLVGSWCVFKNFSTGLSYEYRTATEHSAISKSMHLKNIFIHPTVMCRAEAVNKWGPYPEQFPYAEDYGLFYNILRNGHCAVIPAMLVTCEINPKGISLSHRREQLKSRIKVVNHYGTSNVFKAIGVLRLMMLIAMPYKIGLLIKRLLYS